MSETSGVSEPQTADDSHVRVTDAGRDGAIEGLLIHVCEHEHGAGTLVLDDHGHEPVTLGEVDGRGHGTIRKRGS